MCVEASERAEHPLHLVLASGALAYLTKPLNLTELGDLLDSFTTPAQDHQPPPGGPIGTSMNRSVLYI
jgi:hypothetical protein